MLLYAIVTLALCRATWAQLDPQLLEASENAENAQNEQETLLQEAVDLGYFFTAKNLEETKISGGSYAQRGQFPFMAVVHRLVGNGAISQCGGSILNKRWVLTAGHCVAKEPHRFLVVFGITSKAGVGYDYYSGPGVSMLTTQGAVHPQYRASSNDIGLLYMPKDIPFSNSIQPVTLAGTRFAPGSFVDKTAYVIGWGRDTPSSHGTKWLKYAVLPIISNAECRQYWNVDKRNVCTAPGVGSDACQGDSGGPLIVMHNNRPLQIGVVSYGDADCPSSRPGVFTNVAAFLPWIENVVRNSQRLIQPN